LATRNGKSLVVVESPAKARTISRILGSDYDVRASIGHVRDLPERDLGVDVGNGFAPKYVVPKEKSRTIKEIKDAAKKASSIYLATDPDREGEAIAWHLLEAAGIVDADRVVFHEITPEAVQDAFRHPRSIDMNLVDAQQARRVLDRLVGYRLSPFLWRKVRKGLSAGRVQSVAVRLVAEREREILNFKPQEFWTIEATLEKERVPPAFRAKLSGVVGKKDKLEIPNETESERLVAALRSSAYAVEKVQTKAQTRRPAAPFITSTLQQEASRRLGFTTKKTMVVAQALYEGISIDGEGEVGLITYMRTDSTNIASSALAEAREFIGEKYGKNFLPASPRAYTKKVKGAQEAHEAIRPTSVRREPDAIRRSLNNDQYRLYNLIWQRMVASQMADALFDQTTADIHATPSSGAAAYLLKATNTQLRFAGYRQVYIEGRDDDEEEDLGTNPLPELASGDPLKLNKLDPKQNFTEPPTRFTEASLIKALEEKGIGRPSTYAPTMSTIQDRGYVEKDGRFLKPSELGFVVNDLLVDHFPDFVDAGFTAQMEDELDDVAEGDRKWQPVVEQFYTPLEKRLEVAVKEAPKQVQETDEVCPESGHPMIIRWGRNGRFLACSGFPECKYTRPLEGEGRSEPQAVEDPCPDCGKTLLVRQSRRGPFIGCSGYPDCRYTRPMEAEKGAGSATAQPQQTDEKCPECESPMVIRSGRYGPFLACSRYPECKGAKPLPTGASCPKDGGELVERRTRRGTFYGCANYPDCDFTVRNRPLPQPCPNCGALLTLERDNSAKCTACDWSGDVPAEAPATEPAKV
jgi:DNA topoisomerase-1